MPIITCTTIEAVATLTWNDEARPVNLLTGAALQELHDHVSHLAADDQVKGIIITSGKPGTFVVGGDLDQIQILMGGSMSAAELVDKTGWVLGVLRAIETCGKPVVAALNGMTLGGGYELALACHYRVLAKGRGSNVGLPEAQMGLMPGAGGTQRLPRLIGVEKAIGTILEGKQLAADKALSLGMVDEVVSAEDLLDAARAWILSAPEPVQPWDKRGFEPPGGGAASPRALQVLMGTNAMVHGKTFGNFPHSRAIISAIHDGLRLPIERACRVESRQFALLAASPVAKGMLRTLYFNMQAASKGRRRPKVVAPTRVQKVGIIGAGLMGGGIAFVCAKAGLQAVLIDRDQASADRGKAYSEGKMQRRIARGRATEAKMTELLQRILPTTDYAELEGCDVVVEAVFEDRDVKATVHRGVQARLGEHAIIGSNTSTLPITGLASAVQHPDRFIGMHFFSPVDRMPLLEVIRGEQTSDETLARTFDFAKAIGKTVIVVNDSRGFYTSRVFGTYISEGAAMLAEGVPPALIENAGRMSGMPMAPLSLADEVGLGLMHQVGEQTRRDLGDAAPRNAATPVLEAMVVEHKRRGRRENKGFYDYGDGVKRLWPGLAEVFAVSQTVHSAKQLVRRFLFVQCLEAARCVDEGVIEDVGEADVGAILGWGFAPWTGGPLSWIDSVGVAQFVAEADEYAARYGERFEPPPLLREMAAQGRSFHGA